MGIFSSKQKEKTVVIFDVGSASVGATLAVIPSKIGKPKLLYTTRSPIVFNKDFKFKEFLFSMLKALEQSALNLENAKLKVPEEAYVFLASPWYASQTRIITLRKNHPFVFNSKLATDLIKKEIDSFKKTQLSKYTDKDNKARILENKNIRVTLNGYKTAKPLYKKAKELEITLFVSMSTDNVLNTLEHRIKKFFNVPVNFSSFLFSSFVVTRDLLMENKDFLLIDVGGEVTDVSVIKDDVLLESISFPFGKNFILRRVMSDSGKTSEESLSLIKMFAGDKLEKKESDKVRELLESARVEWMKHFQESLINMSGSIMLPETIFITADEDIGTWFAQIIKNEEFNQYILTEKKFVPILMDDIPLGDFCDIPETVKHDPFLILESLSTNRVNI